MKRKPGKSKSLPVQKYFKNKYY